jgi:2-oxoglutarate ferredoxin oxidoreductase subunit alpha
MANDKTDFTFRIAGEAGQGITSAGLIFSKTAARLGFFVFDAIDYPSLIRGGHNVFSTRVSREKIYSLGQGVDFLVALNENAVKVHLKELSQGAVVVFNSDRISSKIVSKKAAFFGVPLISLAKAAGGQEVMMNNVALGITAFLLKADFAVLSSVIKDVFSGAKPEIIDLNIKAAKAGFDYAKNNFKEAKLLFNLSKIAPKKAGLKGAKLLLSGNDAICLGAVAAGCKFFSAYPMTPINSLISYFAVKAKDLNMVYYQPEDEIAGINSAIGASATGLRSMVATSGGGFSLMVEAFGMAGMVEVPLVVVEGQRPGPSSGMPTLSGQGDLGFILSASQDDFPRIVLAPGDPEECFWQTIEAFNLADKYQCPVVILVDKNLCENRESVPAFNEASVKIDHLTMSLADQKKDYKRYLLTKTGISPRPIVGRKGNTFLANSYEHDEKGFFSDDAKIRKDMMEKRMRKLKVLKKEMPKPLVFGSKETDIGLISWGSNKGAILQAQAILQERGIKTKFMHLNFLFPFPAKAVGEFLNSAKNILLVEQNISGQLVSLIRRETGFEIKNKLLKYDGRMILPEEIVERVKIT